MGYRVLWYFTGHGTFFAHPLSTRNRITLISGGGSGMGSRPNMSFSSSDIYLAYAMYGRKGGAVCWDTLPTHTVHSADGDTFVWTNHPFWNSVANAPTRPDNPVFLNGDQAQMFYVHAPSMTADTFKLSVNPYVAPGVTLPYIPYNWGQAISFDLTPYRHAVLGGNGGGVIGDQAISGLPIGLYYDGYDQPRSGYKLGGAGRNTRGAGGPGGGASGGVEQIGGLAGNAGYEGGGGGGAGYLLPDGSYPSDWGPGGGAAGTTGWVESELKEQYYWYVGPPAIGGEPGAGGFRGGGGSYPLLQIEEWFPDEVEE